MRTNENLLTHLWWSYCILNVFLFGLTHRLNASNMRALLVSQYRRHLFVTPSWQRGLKYADHKPVGRHYLGVTRTTMSSTVHTTEYIFLLEMKQGQCTRICPLSWSVHCNFTGDGKCNERGWFYPHDGMYARKQPLLLCVLCGSHPHTSESTFHYYGSHCVQLMLQLPFHYSLLMYSWIEYQICSNLFFSE